MATTVLIRFAITMAALAAIVVPAQVSAQSFVAPGDMRLRHDLQLLNDTGAFNVPLTTWPISQRELQSAIAAIKIDELPDSTQAAYVRIRDRFGHDAGQTGVDITYRLAAAAEPRQIRTFEDTPRDDGAAAITIAWQNKQVAVNVAASIHSSPNDGDEFRLDGTYLSANLGNWQIAAGWQDRWFGPGRDGSLILSTNARPTPGLMLQRAVSKPFEARLLRWIGPWTFTTFVSLLDDSRTVDDALLLGVRGAFRPHRSLEIGISRAAQWCGENRPCNLSTFGDLLVGNDNRGVNVAADDEPGNQLGGFDVRWSLPKEIPVAVYMQWIGEDGRGGGGAIGNWLRQVGAEYWGQVGDASHRLHFEVSDSTCRQGGFGFSDSVANCAYEHGIYRTGYRYHDRPLGHGADGDSLSYSIGLSLVQSAGHSWNTVVRYMEINREGAPNGRHTISEALQERMDVQLTHTRRTYLGQFDLGLGFQRLRDSVSGMNENQYTGFVRWSSP